MRNAFTAIQLSQSFAHRRRIKLFGELMHGRIVWEVFDDIQCEFLCAHGLTLAALKHEVKRSRCDAKLVEIRVAICLLRFSC